LRAPVDGVRRTIWRQTQFGAKPTKVAPVAPQTKLATVAPVAQNLEQWFLETRRNNSLSKEATNRT